MASWDHQLLASVVLSDESSSRFEAAEKSGITYRTFGSPEVKVVWSRIKTHYERPQNFGHVPGEQTLREWFPSLELPKPSENFKDLCAMVLDGYVRRKLDKALSEAITGLADNPHETATKLLETLGQLQETTTKSRDQQFSTSALRDEAEAYRKRRDSDGVVGLPYPWAQMNKDTRGMSPGDYIMIWATPKSMKTWLGLIITAHLVKSGYKCLIYSKEMMWPTIRQRMCAIMAGVNYDRLLDGTLSAAEEAHYFATIEQVTSPAHRGDFHFTDADRADGATGGPADIRRKVEIYKPDFVFLDSSYMLELPGAKNDNVLDWKVLSVINRQVKQIAKACKIPILAVFQENETQAYKYVKTRGTASLAMNKGAVMDCDLGIRLVYHSKLCELTIRYAVGREVKADGFTINAVPCENFTYAGTHLHDLGDDFKDEEEEDPKGGKGAPAPAAAQPPAGTRAGFIQQPGLRVVRADPIDDDFAHLDHAADEDEDDGEEAAP
jgi:hypothetical protein